MVVQAMLLEYWKNIKETHRVVPKAPAVDGGIHKETTLLIAEFQRRYMHRPKPQGFINPAMAANKTPPRSGTSISFMAQPPVLMIQLVI